MGTDPVQLIANDPEILVFTQHDLSIAREDHNVDIEVRVSGERWSATFFTLDNLRSLMEGYSASGECAFGAYLWAADMLVVPEISATAIRNVVADLLATDELRQAFTRLDDD